MHTGEAHKTGLESMYVFAALVYVHLYILAALGVVASDSSVETPAKPSQPACEQAASPPLSLYPARKNSQPSIVWCTKI